MNTMTIFECNFEYNTHIAWHDTMYTFLLKKIGTQVDGNQVVLRMKDELLHAVYQTNALFCSVFVNISKIQPNSNQIFGSITIVP